eukprot:6866446-Lingulodinium_polyedra.AAC.1
MNTRTIERLNGCTIEHKCDGPVERLDDRALARALARLIDGLLVNSDGRDTAATIYCCGGRWPQNILSRGARGSRYYGNKCNPRQLTPRRERRARNWLPPRNMDAGGTNSR